MSENNISTDDVLQKFKDFYNAYYKVWFNEYFVELDFKTILVYYSGMCGLVVECTSLPNLSVYTNIGIIVNYSKDELFSLHDEVVHNVIKNEILDRYEIFMSINRKLCNKRFSKRIIIKNAHFKEPLLGIKIEKNELIIELQENMIRNMKCEDYGDLINILSSLNRYFIESYQASN